MWMNIGIAQDMVWYCTRQALSCGFVLWVLTERGITSHFYPMDMLIGIPAIYRLMSMQKYVSHSIEEFLS